MNNLCDNTSDLETYARHLGFIGTDFDVFYESYYSINTEEIEELLEEWGY